MARLKPILFVVGLSLLSAVTLRLLLGRASRSLQPAPVPPATVDSTELARRMVGCGHLRFVFDSLGWRSGQWPEEVDPVLAASRRDAVIWADQGSIVAVLGEERGPRVGEYLIRDDTVYLSLGPEPGGVRARLVPSGDSLAGRLERIPRRPPAPVIGRLFVATPLPAPGGCRVPSP